MNNVFVVEIEDADGGIVRLSVPSLGGAPPLLVNAAFSAKPPPRRVTMWLQDEQDA